MKKHALRRWLAIGTAVAGFRLGLRLLARAVQRRLNPVRRKPPYPVSGEARRLHEGLLIADLHADPLLWDTPLWKRQRTGHVDIPRLQRGNVALQVFGVVTKVPRPERDATFGAGPDLIGWLAATELWPIPAWFDLAERALYQSRKLKQAEKRSGGRFAIIRSRQALVDFLDRRSTEPRSVGGILALEGAHALGSNPAKMEALYDAGFRIVGITHLFDNLAGGSSLGTERYGLTDYGRELVRRLEEWGFLIDLAHASPALFEDVLATTTRPVLVSHTGVQGVCPNPRNLTDRQMEGVARRGGLIGIGFDALFTCEASVAAIADSIEYAAELAGVKHVALGSDFDGAIQPPFDVTGLPVLTEQLMKDGIAEADIRKIMGENAIRFLLENLR